MKLISTRKEPLAAGIVAAGRGSMQRAHLRATHPALVATITLAALGAFAALAVLTSGPAIAPRPPSIVDDRTGTATDGVPAQPAVAPGGAADSATPGLTTGTREGGPGSADANARPVKPGPEHMELIDEEPQLTQNRRLPPAKRDLTE